MSLFDKLKKKKIEAQTRTDSAQTDVARSREFGGASPLIIKQAWITEKAGTMSQERKYIFVVQSKANKPAVKKAVEVRYGVKVDSVHIINKKGKAKRLGLSKGRTSGFKKAIVTLREGEKIEALTP